MLAWLIHCVAALAGCDQLLDGGEQDTIRSALTSYRGAIYSLDASYTLEAYAGPPIDGHRSVVAFSSDCRWLLRGQRILIETKDRKPSGDLFKHVLWSFDGLNSWQVGFDPHGTPAKQVTWKSDRLARPWDQAVTLADFVGWKVVGLHQSILDLLNSRAASDGEYVDLSGHRCFRIVLHRWAFFDDNPTHVLVVWFDPLHGWLPRQIQVMPEAAWKSMCGQAEAPEFEAGFQFHNFVVEEFREIAALGNADKLWFPLKATSNGGGMTELRLSVQAISLNSEIAVSSFTPAVPKGSALYENYGTARQRIVPPASADPSISPMPDAAFSLASNTISAAPPKGSMLGKLFLSCSLLLLVIAALLRLRKSRSLS